MQKRNWNKDISLETETPERNFQLRSLQMKFLSVQGALKRRDGTGIGGYNYEGNYIGGGIGNQTISFDKSCVQTDHASV